MVRPESRGFAKIQPFQKKLSSLGSQPFFVSHNDPGRSVAVFVGKLAHVDADEEAFSGNREIDMFDSDLEFAVPLALEVDGDAAIESSIGNAVEFTVGKNSFFREFFALVPFDSDRCGDGHGLGFWVRSGVGYDHNMTEEYFEVRAKDFNFLNLRTLELNFEFHDHLLMGRISIIPNIHHKKRDAPKYHLGASRLTYELKFIRAVRCTNRRRLVGDE